MADAPSWLSNDDNAAAPAAATQSFEMSSGADGAPAASTTSVPDDPDLPGVILTMRLANMGVAAGLMACSVSDSEDRRQDGYHRHCPSQYTWY